MSHTRFVPIIPLLAALVLATPAPARTSRAPKVVPNPLSQIPVRGSTSQGRFRGRLAVDSFTVGSDGVTAAGTLRGTLDDHRYPGPQPVRDTNWELAVTVVPVGGEDCAQLNIDFAEKKTRFLSLPATIPAGAVRIRTTARSSRALREVACAVTTGLADSGGAFTNSLLHDLNALAHLPPEKRR